MDTTPKPTMTASEIEELCHGLTQAAAMVKRLQADGFARARLVNGKVVLERAHYEAVCRGEYARHTDRERPRLQLEGIR